MTVYDITRTIRPTLAVWPGDTPYALEHLARISDGAPVNLTTLTLSAHTGTHADAYYHYEADGAHPAAMPLTAYIGRARVVQVARRAGSLTAEDFAIGALDGVERLLIKSHVSDLPDDQWPSEFPYPSPALIAQLAAQGCVLIGLDSPSFDDLNDKQLPGHHALARAGMANLETLALGDVPEGDYELVALPLKLDGACGSPVRAVLRPLRD
jgi:arylformamidase